jgi:predicted  nucleic acid-binding Zn-ribbon protein
VTTALEKAAVETGAELATVRRDKVTAEEALSAVTRAHAAAAEAMTAAEGKHAELAEVAAAAEARVNGVVAQLEWEQKEVRGKGATTYNQ